MDKVYRVNSIFYSLQGEGRNTGRAALFVRFAGCNLRCPFCDTQFDTYTEMTADSIIAAIRRHAPHLQSPLPLVVLTGGEPTLQVDEALVDRLHAQGYRVAMESNGTLPAPANLDWLTVSPKNWQKAKDAPWTQDKGKRCDELKIVFDETTARQLPPAPPCPAGHQPLLYLQPCDTGDPLRNAAIVQQCVDYIKHHPQWCLSLQTHKLIDIE